MDNTQREEMLDRLMHQTLEEKLGAARSCDVADRIGGATPLPRTRLTSRTWFRVSVVAASALIVVVAALNRMQPNFMSSASEHDASLADARVHEKVATNPEDAMASRLGGRSASQMLVEPGDYDYADDVKYGELAGQDAAIVFDKSRSIATSANANKKEQSTATSPVFDPASAPWDARASDGLGDSIATKRGDNGISISAGPAGGISVDAAGVVELPDTLSRGQAATRPAIGDESKGSRKTVLSTVEHGTGKVPALHDSGDRSGITLGLPAVTEGDKVDIDGDGVPDYEVGRIRGAPDTGEGRDRFARVHDNRFLRATDQPLSTFSIDVDTASYSVVRSRIERRVLPPAEAVRVEELVNYFAYDYPQPTDGAPFAVHVDVAACPWAVKHRLVRIGLKGKEIAKNERPASNLVFLVDVSGSMQPNNKLPLVRHGLLRLVGELDERDRVAIVVYAGSSGCVLASTPCTQANKERIRSAIDGLRSGGSTNGAAGIELAYQISQDHFVKGGANRVILCTDGDFNVGATSDEALKQLVAERAKSGVFLTALGFGMGNHNDQMLETIADNGNGAYGYIDDEREVEKLFVRQLSGTLITIAKDVKIQVEFNPAEVGAYRLIGYENRILAKEDFNNDKKDAGDIGAGHTVTALYEIVPAGLFDEVSEKNAAAVGQVGGGDDRLEFQRPKQELELTDAAKTSGDLLLVKLRYKAPDGDVSTLIRTAAKDGGATFAAAGNDFKFAASVAAFGMILRQSPFRGDATLATVEEIATANVGEDTDGQRRAFVNLVRQSRQLTGDPGLEPRE
ncbi:MAG: VWA domain-containing protein [Pirellulales bacterium]